MFQTEIHAFLQQIDSPLWTEFMLFVSQMGRRPAYMFLILFFMFGVEYRRGFIAFQAMLWTISVTIWLKELFDYPRPYHVNEALDLIDYRENKIRLPNAEAPSFFSLIPDKVLGKIREVKDISNGFPSGHTSIALSFWGSVALVFNRRWLKVFAAVFVTLTITSRMFLAQHFLADILGGLVLGSISLIVIYRWMQQKKDFTKWKAFEIQKKRRLVFFLFAPLVLALMPHSHPETVGFLFGLNFGVWFSCKDGFPDSRGVWWKRLLRPLIVSVVFLATYYAAKSLLPASTSYVMIAFEHFFVLATTIILTNVACWKLKLFNGKLVTKQDVEAN